MIDDTLAHIDAVLAEGEHDGGRFPDCDWCGQEWHGLPLWNCAPSFEPRPDGTPTYPERFARAIPAVRLWDAHGPVINLTVAPFVESFVEAMRPVSAALVEFGDQIVAAGKAAGLIPDEPSKIEKAHARHIRTQQRILARRAERRRKRAGLPKDSPQHGGWAFVDNRYPHRLTLANSVGRHEAMIQWRAADRIRRETEATPAFRLWEAHGPVISFTVAPSVETQRLIANIYGIRRR